MFNSIFNCSKLRGTAGTAGAAAAAAAAAFFLAGLAGMLLITHRKMAQRCSEIPEEMKNSETAAAELRETAVSESEMTARTPGYNQDSEPFFEKFRDPKNSETSAVESSLMTAGFDLSAGRGLPPLTPVHEKKKKMWMVAARFSLRGRTSFSGAVRNKVN